MFIVNCIVPPEIFNEVWHGQDPGKVAPVRAKNQRSQGDEYAKSDNYYPCHFGWCILSRKSGEYTRGKRV